MINWFRLLYVITVLIKSCEYDDLVFNNGDVLIVELNWIELKYFI